MKQQQQSKKKSRPKHDFKTTANGFVLNGREVVVEYKTRRRQGTAEQLRLSTPL